MLLYVVFCLLSCFDELSALSFCHRPCGHAEDIQGSIGDKVPVKLPGTRSYYATHPSPITVVLAARDRRGGHQYALLLL